MKSILKSVTVLSVVAFMALAACQPSANEGANDSPTNTPTMEETEPEVAPDGGASMETDTVMMDSVSGS